MANPHLFVQAVCNYDSDRVDRFLREDPSLATGLYSGQTPFELLYRVRSYHASRRPPGTPAPPADSFNRCLLLLLSALRVSGSSQTPHALSRIVAAGHASSFSALAHVPWVRAVMVCPSHRLPNHQINGHFLLRLATKSAQIDPAYPFLDMVKALFSAGWRPDRACPTHGDPLTMVIAPTHTVHPNLSRHRTHRDLAPVCRALRENGAPVSGPALREAVITDSREVVESMVSNGGLSGLSERDLVELVFQLKPLFPMGSALVHREVLSRQTQTARSSVPRFHRL